jgi:predicted dehydrogenase
MEIPERFRLAPEGTPTGPPRNVAQGYVRFAQALAAGETYHPDFDHAVKQHALIEAIERSAAEGRAVRL